MNGGCCVVRTFQKSIHYGARKTVHGEVSPWRHSAMKLPKRGARGDCWAMELLAARHCRSPAARIWYWGIWYCLHSRSWKSHLCCRSWVIGKAAHTVEPARRNTPDQAFLLLLQHLSVTLYWQSLTSWQKKITEPAPLLHIRSWRMNFRFERQSIDIWQSLPLCLLTFHMLLFTHIWTLIQQNLSIIPSNKI